MHLQSLSVVNYKNIREAELNFSPKTNCFIGLNGMGKTNLLDAIYYLSFCKSHLSAIDLQNMRHGADFFMLQGQYLRAGAQESILCGMRRRQKKHIRRNRKEYERLSEHIGLLPLVLVSPDDAALIRQGSEERRKFTDGVISQCNKTYLNELISYRHALRQRNALLKQEVSSEEQLLDIWEERMAAHGRYIYECRKRFIDEFTPIFQDFYSFIADENEEISLSYRSQHDRYDVVQHLRETRPRDRLLGYSTCGVHKDELEMTLGGYPIKQVGSQGQNKTYLIALKLAQFSFLKRVHGFTPILLLDDLFDKLDERRVEKIVELVSGDEFGQIFITDTHREHLDRILTRTGKEHLIFHVKNGEVTV